MFYRWVGVSKICCRGECVCIVVCGPLMDWQYVQNVHCFFPYNSFNNVSDPTKDEAGTEIKTTDGYILQV